MVALFFSKFLSSFHWFRNYRGKSFSLYESKVLGKKFKATMLAAFRIKVTPIVWKMELLK